MKILKFNEKKWWESDPWKMDSEEVMDYLIEFIDDDEQFEIETNDLIYTQTELAQAYKSPGYVHPIYVQSKPIDRFESPDVDFDETKDGVTYLLIKLYHPKGRIKGNLDLDGYTRSMLKHYFKKFVRMSEVPVNILIKIIDSNLYNEPLSRSIVRIEFLNELGGVGHT
jgi:hypothetical protein